MSEVTRTPEPYLFTAIRASLNAADDADDPLVARYNADNVELEYDTRVMSDMVIERGTTASINLAVFEHGTTSLLVYHLPESTDLAVATLSWSVPGDSKLTLIAGDVGNGQVIAGANLQTPNGSSKSQLPPEIVTDRATCHAYLYLASLAIAS